LFPLYYGGSHDLFLCKYAPERAVKNRYLQKSGPSFASVIWNWLGNGHFSTRSVRTISAVRFFNNEHYGRTPAHRFVLPFCLCYLSCVSKVAPPALLGRRTAHLLLDQYDDHTGAWPRSGSADKRGQSCNLY